MFQRECNDLQQLFRRIGAAIRAVSAHFQAANHDMESAVALDLTLEPVEEITFKFHDLATAKTGHVDVIALRTPLVEVLLALHVHQVEFVNQSVALEQLQSAINGNAVDSGIKFAGMPQDLRSIKVLLGGFDDAKNRAALPSQAKAARRQRSLQTSGSFSCRKGHCSYLDETVLQQDRTNNRQNAIFSGNSEGRSQDAEVKMQK
jgi:hypothetical protein